MEVVPANDLPLTPVHLSHAKEHFLANKITLQYEEVSQTKIINDARL